MSTNEKNTDDTEEVWPHPDLAAVIMAGGAGTRFWPLSTEQRPKQFLELFGDRTLLQMSYDRLAGPIDPKKILVLTSANFVDLCRAQLPDIPPENIVGEPMRRDTAAAVCLGALLAKKRFGDCTIVTATADHRIEPTDAFRDTMISAARWAAPTGALYTFGVAPAYAATGYGYLELGDRLAVDKGIEHFHLRSFREKPDAATAQGYVDSGRHCWNSGMFVWTANAIVSELKRNLPRHVEGLAKAVEADGTGGWKDALTAAFERLAPISIDFAVMEKAADVRCVRAEFSWSDVGGWNALREFLDSDEHENAHRAELVTLDASGNLVFADDPSETVVLIGVSDLIAVRAGDKTLIVPKDRAEEIKTVVKRMKGE